MKILNITPVGRQRVYDLSVEDAEHYALKNGVITHNTGAYYSADNIWVIGRRQDKEGTEIQGYHFIIRTEKSRFVREGSKIPISVSFEGGIMKWSGLLEIALEGGFVIKPKNGRYARFDKTTQTQVGPNLKEEATQTAEFWNPLLADPEFVKYVESCFKLVSKNMIKDDNEIDEDEDADEV